MSTFRVPMDPNFEANRRAQLQGLVGMMTGQGGIVPPLQRPYGEFEPPAPQRFDPRRARAQLDLDRAQAGFNMEGARLTPEQQQARIDRILLNQQRQQVFDATQLPNPIPQSAEQISAERARLGLSGEGLTPPDVAAANQQIASAQRAERIELAQARLARGQNFDREMQAMEMERQRREGLNALAIQDATRAAIDRSALESVSAASPEVLNARNQTAVLQAGAESARATADAARATAGAAAAIDPNVMAARMAGEARAQALEAAGLTREDVAALSSSAETIGTLVRQELGRSMLDPTQARKVSGNADNVRQATARLDQLIAQIEQVSAASPEQGASLARSVLAPLPPVDEGFGGGIVEGLIGVATGNRDTANQRQVAAAQYRQRLNQLRALANPTRPALASQ